MDVKQKAFKIKQTCMHKDRPGITNSAWRPKYFRKGKTIQKKLMLTRKKKGTTVEGYKKLDAREISTTPQSTLFPIIVIRALTADGKL